MEPWRTAIVDADETHIWLRGFDVTALMREAGFVDTLFLLLRSRLPTPGERRLLDAMLVGVSDHGAGAPSCAAARLVASGNRQSVAAAVAAGVLAIGDDHGAAAAGCVAMIGSALEAGRQAGRSIGLSASHAIDEAVAARKRLPGLGHRLHTTDPRVAVLFGMAAEAGVAGLVAEVAEEYERERPMRVRIPVEYDGEPPRPIGAPPAPAKD